MSEISFEIVKHLAVLSESKNGWKKEINMVSWNGAGPKYDIRAWDPAHEKMGKGISLTSEEASVLEDALKNGLHPA